MTANRAQTGAAVAPAAEKQARRQLNDDFATRLRGFGPVGILAILVIVSGGLLAPVLSAILVLLWVWWSKTAWREIGYVRPKSWIGDLAIGCVFGSAFKFLLKAFVMPLLGAPAINQAYHYLAGNRAAIPNTLFLLIV